MKILANDGISASGQKTLEQAGFTVVTDKVAQENLAEAINREGYVALLVRSATTARKELIDACPGLKLIGRGGVGIDNIDHAYARSKGIAVVNTPAASSGSVAELVMAHMFSLARQLHDSNRRMPNEGETHFDALKKKYGKGSELRGKTLGIIGFGKIGQSLASYALGCGMHVIGIDIEEGTKSLALEIDGYGTLQVSVPVRKLRDVLGICDIFSLHVPKQSDGRAVIGGEEIAQMKRGVLLLNAARGGSIQEDALLNALNSGQVAGAGLDVYENEPVPRKELLVHPNISLSPHIGAATSEAQDRIGTELAGLVINFFGK
jgi:D-3-phosphoglycerate dehydrogenase